MASFSKALPHKSNSLFTILRISIITFLIIASLGSTSQATANPATTAGEEPPKGAEFKPSSISPADINTPQAVSSSPLIVCGAYGDGWNWSETGVFGLIISCSLTAPQAGYVYISANAWVTNLNGDYEADFKIGIDESTYGEPYTDRYVNIYALGSVGTEESVAISFLKPITSGAHSFYFLGARYSGDGTVRVNDAFLSVIFIPASSTNVLTCGAYGDAVWHTDLDYYQTILQCPASGLPMLSFPEDGWAFISANGSVGLSNYEYEAYFSLNYNDTDREINTYYDSLDGEDRTIAVSALKQISAGSGRFYFMGYRHSGAGTVRVYDPTLSAIYVPSSNAMLHSCGATSDSDWTTTSGSYQIIQQCTLTLPMDGWAFISADASVAYETADTEAAFRIGIDSTSGLDYTDRVVNVKSDGGNGSDKSVAVSFLQMLNAGSHTFYFLGKRNTSTGTVQVYDPTLSVITQGTSVYLPVVLD